MRRTLRYVLVGIAAVLGAAAAAFEPLGLAAAGSSGERLRELVVFAVPFSVVGLLVARARPENVIGWIFLCTGVLWALDVVLGIYARSVLVLGSPDVLGVARLFDWIGRWSWIPLITPALLFAPMFFPDGRLPSPRWWPLPVAGLAAAAVSSLYVGLSPGEDPDGLPGISNPYATEAPWIEALSALAFGTMVLVIIATMGSLVLRMRRGSSLERQQLKVFFFGALVWPVFLIFSLVTGIDVWSSPLSLFAILALPISIGVAILRYRLYDIDLLINRTLVYGALSALLAATYFGAAVLLSALLRPFPAESELAVAGSTLAVVILFAPLRSRIQRLVDERFYRSKYDAARTLDAFAARLRDQVDLDALEREVLGVVGRTVQPAHAALWLRERAR